MKEADKLRGKNFAISQWKTSSSEIIKSEITEHVAANNHIINWTDKSDKTTRWLKGPFGLEVGARTQ